MSHRTSSDSPAVRSDSLPLAGHNEIQAQRELKNGKVIFFAVFRHSVFLSRCVVSQSVRDGRRGRRWKKEVEVVRACGGGRETDKRSEHMQRCRQKLSRRLSPLLRGRLGYVVLTSYLLPLDKKEKENVSTCDDGECFTLMVLRSHSQDLIWPLLRFPSHLTCLLYVSFSFNKIWSVHLCLTLWHLCRGEFETDRCGATHNSLSSVSSGLGCSSFCTLLCKNVKN